MHELGACLIFTTFTGHVIKLMIFGDLDVHKLRYTSQKSQRKVHNGEEENPKFSSRLPQSHP
jgi:hypothetical protein